ncbi:hypothetical protein TKK_0015786 [Trichogramma kaykai]|uniref:Prokineticin domain-containing protein n=1 Tax=Trichogramma kaykai TaxID=54128 RepID=A0ABD2W8I0_9HYME
MLAARIKFSLSLLLLIGAVNAATLHEQTGLLADEIECTSNVDCAPGYCCTISHERYSYPRCQKFQDLGDFCRPGGPLTTSGDRYYPDGTSIQLDEIYMQFCPCGPGLLCDRGEQVCRDASDFNSVQLNQSGKSDD